MFKLCQTAQFTINRNKLINTEILSLVSIRPSAGWGVFRRGSLSGVEKWSLQANGECNLCRV